ncbi:MAG: hypothetical protein WCT07_02565 [Candidatus Paceibacterota bacterium]|jgi:hypothetical protein
MNNEIEDIFCFLKRHRLDRNKRLQATKFVKGLISQGSLAPECLFNIYKICSYKTIKKLIAEELEKNSNELSREPLLFMVLNPLTKDLGIKFLNTLIVNNKASVEDMERISKWSKILAIKKVAKEALDQMKS